MGYLSQLVQLLANALPASGQSLSFETTLQNFNRDQGVKLGVDADEVKKCARTQMRIWQVATCHIAFATEDQFVGTLHTSVHPCCTC